MSASQASLSDHVYLKVYAGSGGGSAKINGTTINFHEASGFDLAIRSVSDVSGEIYLFGVNRNVIYGGTITDQTGSNPLPNPIIDTVTIRNGEAYEVNGILTIANTGILIIEPNGQLRVIGEIVNNGILINNGSLILS